MAGIQATSQVNGTGTQTISGGGQGAKGKGKAKGHAKKLEGAAGDAQAGTETSGKKAKKVKDKGGDAGATTALGGAMACGMTMGGGAAAKPAATATDTSASEATLASTVSQLQTMLAAPTLSYSAVAGMAGDGVTQAGHAHGGGGAEAGAHGPELLAPATGDPRFLDGTTGPVVKEGDAKTVKIPDGKGFGGAKGTKQNNNDKEQNNYSVTDANYNPRLGLLAKNPDTGEELNYVQHIQMYNAAGYLETFAPQTYATLVANQNAGKGTVLGGAAKLMGLVQANDPALEGVTGADIPAQVPGSTMDAKAYIQSGKDITGQNWARMHHPQSAWTMYKNLVDKGVDWQNAMVLSGDDGVSGAGRVNGVNNQNGSTGFNGGEKEIWSLGAQIQQQTGIDVIGAMMAGHNHNDQGPDALTNPRINKKIGAAKDDRSMGRSAAIAQALLDGTVGSAEKAAKDGTKADNKKLLAAAGVSQSDAGGNAVQQNTGGGGNAAPAADAATPVANAIGGAAALAGGGGDMMSVIAGLLAQLQSLILQLQGGGAATQAPAQQETEAGIRVPSPTAELAYAGAGAAAGSTGGGCG